MCLSRYHGYSVGSAMTFDLKWIRAALMYNVSRPLEHSRTIFCEVPRARFRSAPALGIVQTQKEFALPR